MATDAASNMPRSAPAPDKQAVAQTPRQRISASTPGWRARTFLPILSRAPVAALCCALLSACATRTPPGWPGHITEAQSAPGAIPEPVRYSAAPPAPVPAAKVETYSVTVHNVAAQSLLFALARDAGMNIDIHPGIEGNVTLNALDQTLPQLLARIGRQVDMRYEIDGKTLIVQPDTPMWRNYRIDYVNIARSTSSSVNIATQISTTGGGGSGGAAANPSGNNNSTTSVVNRSDNNFWYSLEKNIRDMLRESTLSESRPDPLAQTAAPAPSAANQAQRAAAEQFGQSNQPGQSGAPGPFAQPGQPGQPGQFAQSGQSGQYGQYGQASQFGGAMPGASDAALAAPALRQANKGSSSSVIVNAEGGLIAVRATGRMHEKIQEFLDIIQSSAKRQVLIEATIIEVRLNDQYQQGINWSRLQGRLTMTQQQVGAASLPSGISPGTSPGLFVLNYLNPVSRLGNVAATVQLLESFGQVKVLSSPKISVLNNQTALLKVVDNNVFFTIKVTPAVIGPNGSVTTPATYESRLETVPVGFVMSVTPQIAESDEVTLNVRPTITRIVGYVQDPNPALAAGNVVSKVPVIQARELESVMKVNSGQVAVMGGLMQDSVDNARDGVPLLSRIPVLGSLFSYRNENSSKTELVIFMRPVVVRDASMSGDYKDYRYLLPGRAPDAGPYPASKPAPEPAGTDGS